MTFFLHNLFLLISLSLAFLSGFLTPNVQADLIADICTSNRNPSYCLKVLRSKSYASGENLRDLGQVAVKKAQLSAWETYKLVIALIDRARTRKLKEKYHSCLEFYADAIKSLHEWEIFLNTRNYGNLPLRGLAVFADSYDCDHRFVSAPGTESVPLKQGSKKLQDLCGILGDISNRLGDQQN